MILTIKDFKGAVNWSAKNMAPDKNVKGSLLSIAWQIQDHAKNRGSNVVTSEDVKAILTQLEDKTEQEREKTENPVEAGAEDDKLTQHAITTTRKKSDEIRAQAQAIITNMMGIPSQG